MRYGRLRPVEGSVEKHATCLTCGAISATAAMAATLCGDAWRKRPQGLQLSNT